MNATVLIVGFSPVALRSLAELEGPASVILVEEPDVVRKRGVREAVAAAPVVAELVEWDYQVPGAADRLAVQRPDLRPTAVVPLVEYATPFAARLSERLGRPGAGLGAAQLLRDKHLLRQVTRAAGIHNPESQEVAGPQDVRAFMARHPGPVILKPANRQAAVGTRVLTSAAEVDEAWLDCLQQDEGAMVPDRPVPLRMLVERCVVGQEYSVEMLVQRGTSVFSNVTQKTLHPGVRPVEVGHTVPAPIPGDLEASLVESTARVLAAVAFDSGIVHCEWIVADGVPWLVECAGRFAGDGIIELIERAYPVDLVASFYRVMKGEQLPAPLPARAERAASVQFLVGEPGILEEVTGLEEARALPGVTSCAVAMSPGDRVPEVRSSWDRLGSALAVGATPAEAAARAQAALDRLTVSITSDAVVAGVPA